MDKLTYQWFQYLDGRVGEVLGRLDKMALDLTKLKASVGKVEDVDKAVETLLQNLSAQLKNAVTQQDLDAVSAIADQIDKDATDLAAAVTANTPQGPPAQAPKKYATGRKKK